MWRGVDQLQSFLSHYGLQFLEKREKSLVRAGVCGEQSRGQRRGVRRRPEAMTSGVQTLLLHLLTSFYAQMWTYHACHSRCIWRVVSPKAIITCAVK